MLPGRWIQEILKPDRSGRRKNPAGPVTRLERPTAVILVGRSGNAFALFFRGLGRTE
jgi:hypothetical protein